jgi:hypothetical protein
MHTSENAVKPKFAEKAFYEVGCIGLRILEHIAEHYLGKRIEALKHAPYLGTFWGGWSQWRNRIPRDQQGGSLREARRVYFSVTLGCPIRHGCWTEPVRGVRVVGGWAWTN